MTIRMKAKDIESIRALVEQAQTVIAFKSFKAGQESRCDWHKPLPIIITESFSAGKEAGIREVVEFVHNLIIGIDGNHGCIVLDMNEDQWQAKLKEWEIK